jgi:hypothetical protein
MNLPVRSCDPYGFFIYIKPFSIGITNYII